MTQPHAHEDPSRQPPFSAVVLCGGRSRRFGAQKALAEWRGSTLIARQLALLETISTDVFISTNQPGRFEHLGRPMVADRRVGMGPLGGIESSLRHARHDYLAVIACDMPFASGELLRYLAGLACEEFDILVPVRERPPRGLRPEPLHAVYARSALPVISRAIDLDHLKPARLIDETRSRVVPPEEWRRHVSAGIPWHANINTVADLAHLEAVISCAAPDEASERSR